MMNTRNLVIIAVLVVLLAGINFMQKSSHKKSTSGSAMTTLISEQWTVDSIGRINLSLGADESMVTLVKNPDQSWTVSSAWNAPGDIGKIGSLLENLAGLKGEFRSDDAAVLNDYQLGQDQAVAMRAFANDGTLAFEILAGKTAEGAQGNFVRLPSENRVHMTQVSLLSPLGLYSGLSRPLSKHFIQLSLLDLDKVDVNKILLEDGDQSMELVKVFAEPEPKDGAAATTPDRKTWQWHLAADMETPLAKAKVDAVMNALLGMRAVEVDDPTGNAEGYGLQTITRQATLFLEDGSSVVMEFGSQREAGIGGSSGSTVPAGRWMHRPGKDDVWIITDYTVNNIFKNVDELKAEQGI